MTKYHWSGTILNYSNVEHLSENVISNKDIYTSVMCADWIRVLWRLLSQLWFIMLFYMSTHNIYVQHNLHLVWENSVTSIFLFLKMECVMFNALRHLLLARMCMAVCICHAWFRLGMQIWPFQKQTIYTAYKNTQVFMDKPETFSLICVKRSLCDIGPHIHLYGASICGHLQCDGTLICIPQ